MHPFRAGTETSSNGMLLWAPPHEFLCEITIIPFAKYAIWQTDRQTDKKRSSICIAHRRKHPSNALSSLTRAACRTATVCSLQTQAGAAAD